MAILVFPFRAGAEIRRCQEDLAELAAQLELAVLPLHGDSAALPSSDVRSPLKARRAAVILSTNVAESFGDDRRVTTVIDSGLAQIAGPRPLVGGCQDTARPAHLPGSGSAAERAGPVVREPGQAIRLTPVTITTQARSPSSSEIRRIDPG